MASPNNLNYPFVPPPTHPSPDSHTTVIVAVFVSLGGLFFLAILLAAVLCCYIKKKKKKNKRKTVVQETDVVDVDERMKIKEAIVEGHHGPQVVVLEIGEEVHVDEEIKKKEIMFGELGLHAKSAETNASSALQEGQSSSAPNIHHHQLDHKT